MQRVFAVVNLNDPTVFAPSQNFAKLGDFVSVLIPNAFVIAGVIAFLLIIFGGFGIIIGAGSGDPKRMEQGQKAITGAVTGLIIIVVSFWIIQVIEKLTGITLLPVK